MLADDAEDEKNQRSKDLEDLSANYNNEFPHVKMGNYSKGQMRMLNGEQKKPKCKFTPLNMLTRKVVNEKGFNKNGIPQGTGGNYGIQGDGIQRNGIQGGIQGDGNGIPQGTGGNYGMQGDGIRNGTGGIQRNGIQDGTQGDGNGTPQGTGGNYVMQGDGIKRNGIQDGTQGDGNGIPQGTGGNYVMQGDGIKRDGATGTGIRNGSQGINFYYPEPVKDKPLRTDMEIMTSMVKSLNLFCKEPALKELNPAITKRDNGGWQRIQGVMDSGASESVAHPSMCPQYAVRPSAGSIAGQKYVSASGDVIANLGEQVLDIETDDGMPSQIRYQSADVSRPLNSVSEICDAGGSDGQYVVFSKYGGVIMNLHTGRRTAFNRVDGIYELGLWVRPPSTEASVFPRPVVR